MKLQLAINDRAQQQLDDACRWWSENRSPDQAERWYNEFCASLHSICEHPDRFPLAPEDNLFLYKIQQINFGLGSDPTHRALFAVH